MFCLVVIVLLKFQTLENLVAGIGNRGCYVSKERAVLKITLFTQTMTKPPLLCPHPSTSLPPLRVERDNARVNCCLGFFHSFIDKAERPLKIVLRILCFFCLFF